MARRKILKPPLFATLLTLIFAAAAVCVFAVARHGGKLDFSAAFYYVCYGSFDGAVSAGSVSDAVESYGGAGYVIESGGLYYITFACYYEKDDAEKVIAALAEKNIDCKLLTVSRSDYELPNFSAKRNGKLYKNTLTALVSLSRAAYECANAIDRGECSQSAAKSVLSSIDDGLNSLGKSNGDDCFGREISRLKGLCFAAAEGYVFSKDLRALQIAFTDAVISVELY